MTNLKNKIPLYKTCQEAAALMLSKQDRPLRLMDRIALQIHLWICKACPRFEKQLHQMKRSLSDWRNELNK
jgi:hypothetical protein